jgi:vitamin B12 transporter
MKPYRLLLAAAACAAVLPATASAQRPAEPDTFRLTPVVVTATRLGVPLAEVPGTVTVITGEELRQRGLRMVSEALRLVPGVNVVQSAGPGGLTSIFMRGGESDYVQVLIDGVQANDAGGAFNWAHLRADDVERIEIVRGPASVLYGSDAVTGVVQIFTRSGGAPRIEAGASTHRGDRVESDDAFATHGFDASLAGASDVGAFGGLRASYGVNAGRLSSTGIYAFNRDYSNTSVSSRLRLTGSRGEMNLSARHNDNTFHYPTTGSGVIVNPNQFATGQTWSLGSEAALRVTDRVEVRLQGTSHTFTNRTEDPADQPGGPWSWNTADQSRRRLDARANVHLGRFVLTAGADREWQRGETAIESMSQWGPYSDETANERDNTGAYTQLHGAPAERFSVTAGARVDENSAFGSFVTGRLAASYAPLATSRLHVAIGTAFKEPTFFENYASGWTRGNPDLAPETSRSREAGAEYALAAGRVTLGATWFDQQFSNLIQYSASPGPDTPNYGNVGSATARGLELSAALAAGAGLGLRGHYTLTRTSVRDAGLGADVAFQQDRQLLRRPAHQAVLSVNWLAAENVRTIVDLRHVGARDDLDFTDPAQWSGIRTTLDAYTVVDAGVEVDAFRRAAAGLTVALRVRNAFDTDYVEIYNFPRPGRVFELGARTRLPLR